MAPRAQQEESQSVVLWRPTLLLVFFVALAGVLLWRALSLQILDREFLQNQGDARHLRVVEMPAHRGAVTDRYGDPLALSSPVDSVWAHPGYLLESGADLTALASLLGLNERTMRRRLEARSEREFVYLRRHLSPDRAAQVMELGLPGVALQREYRRFYPAGEVTAHVLGFTNIDDRGQEGLELSFDEWLRGEPGAKRVLRDRLGRRVRDVESLREPRPGNTLALSIDRRLQYLAYRELKAAVREHGARGGSLVLLDVKTGEVLAMVNQPSFNPNNRTNAQPAHMRNRAVTDAFEPGSTVKPLLIAAALESGQLRPDSVINTSPGVMRVGGHTVRDFRDYGTIDLSTLLNRSSTVGAAKVGLELEDDVFWELLVRFGFGMTTGTGFPGESAGSLPIVPPRSAIERATLSYGYGLSVTPLQLAQSYATLAADGVQRPISFLKLEEAPDGEQVLDANVAQLLREMMEGVAGSQGTGRRAGVSGYRIAGKTGTAKNPLPAVMPMICT
ncbi:penicillin-binding transpeptidase domain-containing protein [Alkalilimnicola ehrlichii]|uniref:peptidoglycan D,D-transpeptidase FtsI family protein n=1 Tax=Alkalilimnicola ehrlichii TaxID=351052 RepID=UPI0026890791|nr:penicillin-binding transpeptidase domain-containing protein [Alkalilimnicola ehrlichii]